MSFGHFLLKMLVLPLCVMGSFRVAVSDEPHPALFLHNGVTAHRGNSEEFPENTLAAFQSGIDLHADWLELDIFRTTDGEIVISHDARTGRVAGRNLVIPESTYAELLELDVATGFRTAKKLSLEKCPPVRIPTLQEVLKIVLQQHKTRVSLQPKMDCITDAMKIVHTMGAAPWVGFNDGNLNYMLAARQIDPQVHIFWDRGPNTEIDEDIRVARQHGFESLVLNSQGVTAEKVQKIRAAGIEAGAWTVNDEATMRKMLDCGVQRLYTDHPRLLFKVLAERN
jgi:glycerophosphoryl diester phosphodiesterase